MHFCFFTISDVLLPFLLLFVHSMLFYFTHLAILIKDNCLCFAFSPSELIAGVSRPSLLTHSH